MFTPFAFFNDSNRWVEVAITKTTFNAPIDYLSVTENSIIITFPGSFFCAQNPLTPTVSSSWTLIRRTGFTSTVITENGYRFWQKNTAEGSPFEFEVEAPNGIAQDITLTWDSKAAPWTTCTYGDGIYSFYCTGNGLDQRPNWRITSPPTIQANWTQTAGFSRGITSRAACFHNGRFYRAEGRSLYHRTTANLNQVDISVLLPYTAFALNSYKMVHAGNRFIIVQRDMDTNFGIIHVGINDGLNTSDWTYLQPASLNTEFCDVAAGNNKWVICSKGKAGQPTDTPALLECPFSKDPAIASNWKPIPTTPGVYFEKIEYAPTIKKFIAVSNTHGKACVGG